VRWPDRPARHRGGRPSASGAAGLLVSGGGSAPRYWGVPPPRRRPAAGGGPVCCFRAGAALLDIGAPGRRGVDLPKVRYTYWPHRVNFERLSRSRLDWRQLCPGPMVDEPAIGLDRLRLSPDTLPAQVSAVARALPGPLFLPVFASLIPQM